MVKKQDPYRRLEIIIACIGLILLSFQIGILFKQSNIMDSQTDMLDKQTKILDRTTQSNKADLILVPSGENKDYNYKLENLDEPNKEHAYIHVGFINQGKTIVPTATIKIMDGKFLGETRKLKELTSLNYTSTAFFFQVDSYNNKNSRPNENLSVGEYNITFSIDCPYCEQPYKEENITVCIHSEYRKAFEECGQKEKWKLH